MASLGALGAGLSWLTVSRVPEAERPHWPALLVVGGIEPNDLAGPVAILAAAEALVAGAQTNEATRRVLESASILFLPQVAASPASKPSGPREERTVTAEPPVDDDHDGLVDEDGADDLNGDGRITAMRVADSGGEFRSDPREGRLLMPVDRARGEAGAWRLLSEGRDDDGDEAWNEDGRGGVNPNRNFPAGFQFFQSDAGRHPLSEPASRALAEFVVAHPNIAVAFTFGAADNLTETPKGEPGGKRPATALNEADVPWLADLGKGWRQALHLGKPLPGVGLPGTFSDWMYYHRGRLSLAARPWFPGLAIEFTKADGEPAAASGAADAKTNAASAGAEGGKDTGSSPGPAAEKATGKEGKEGSDDDKRNEDERAFLRWLDVHAPSEFAPWQGIEHPDFPGRTVEVGGFGPWVRSNPPASLLAEVVRRQAGFLVELAGKLPRVGIRRSQVKALGSGVFEVRVDVENTGWLPTVLAHGEVTGEVLPTRVALALEETAVLSGTRVRRLGPLAGHGGWEEVRWVVHAPGRSQLEVEVVSALAGRTRVTLNLPEATR